MRFRFIPRYHVPIRCASEFRISIEQGVCSSWLVSHFLIAEQHTNLGCFNEN
jgi:hypothetical protein